MTRPFLRETARRVGGVITRAKTGLAAPPAAVGVVRAVHAQDRARAWWRRTQAEASRARIANAGGLLAPLGHRCRARMQYNTKTYTHDSRLLLWALWSLSIMQVPDAMASLAAATLL
jgi:hypothetical protein